VEGFQAEPGRRAEHCERRGELAGRRWLNSTRILGAEFES
jgi:hypothetical protein